MQGHLKIRNFKFLFLEFRTVPFKALSDHEYMRYVTFSL